VKRWTRPQWNISSWSVLFLLGFISTLVIYLLWFSWICCDGLSLGNRILLFHDIELKWRDSFCSRLNIIVFFIKGIFIIGKNWQYLVVWGNTNQIESLGGHWQLGGSLIGVCRLYPFIFITAITPSVSTYLKLQMHRITTFYIWAFWAYFWVLSFH
jgi:hypothetical protein